MKYADEIFTGRYFIYYYIEELIMRIGSKMEGICYSFAPISK